MSKLSLIKPATTPVPIKVSFLARDEGEWVIPSSNRMIGVSIWQSPGVNNPQPGGPIISFSNEPSVYGDGRAAIRTRLVCFEMHRAIHHLSQGQDSCCISSPAVVSTLHLLVASHRWRCLEHRLWKSPIARRETLRIIVLDEKRREEVQKLVSLVYTLAEVSRTVSRTAVCAGVGEDSEVTMPASPFGVNHAHLPCARSGRHMA